MGLTGSGGERGWGAGAGVGGDVVLVVLVMLGG